MAVDGDVNIGCIGDQPDPDIFCVLKIDQQEIEDGQIINRENSYWPSEIKWFQYAFGFCIAWKYFFFIDEQDFCDQIAADDKKQIDTLSEWKAIQVSIFEMNKMTN